VSEVVHGADAIFNAERFDAKYGHQPNWGEKNRWSYSITKPSLLAAFFYRGIMPEDLRSELRTFVPEPKQDQLALVETLPQQHVEQLKRWNNKTRRSETYTQETLIECREMEAAVSHDLPTVLALIEAGKVAVSDKTRLPNAATTEAISTVLWGGDYYDDAVLSAEQKFRERLGPIRAFAWPLLVQAGKLAEPSGKRLRLSAAGQKAVNAPLEKTVRTLWNRWLKTTLLDELRRMDEIKGQTGKGKRGLTAVAGRRAAVNAMLSQCPTGHWIEVDEFFRYMRSSVEDFDVTRNPWDLYIVDSNYGSLGYDGFHDWPILQGRYALCLLFEYAATLGLIDVAYIPPYYARPDYGNLWGTDDMSFFSRYDGLLYLRLTPLGAYCLGLTSSYTPATPERHAVLRVLPILDIVAVDAALNPGDRLLLDSYTERRGDAVWHLDQAKLLAAVEGGKNIADFRKILEVRSADPLPETVEQFLKDTEDRSGRLQDKGPARLIECSDPALVALIANDSRTKKLCMQAGERHLVVYHETETRFRSALRKLGYSFPK
jgi:hypothetical protein